MKLSQVVFKGIQWSSISQFGRQLVQYVTTIILANILSPNDFGLLAMALVVTGFIEIFKDLGTSSALIHLNEVNQELISSIFWVNILFGTTFTLLVFLSAHLISLFFNSNDIIPVLQVISILFFISSFSILPKAVLERNLQFNKLAKIEIISTVIGAAVGISMAFLDYGVWSLIFQILVNNFVLTVLILIVGKIKPNFRISFIALKSVSNYSLNLVGYNIFNYFVRNADYMLIGKYIGENQLGNYYLAYKIMLYPLQGITMVISRVLFPIYSRLKEDLKKFKEIYLKTTNTIALFTFPMMIGMIVLSNFFVSTFFSKSWDSDLLTELIIILAPVGLIQSIAATVGTIYMSTGKTNWMFGWGILSGIVTIIGFFVGLHWGVIGVAFSYLLVTLILLYPVFYVPLKIIKLSYLTFFRNFEKILAASLIMFGILYMIKVLFLEGFNYLPGLVILLVLGVFFYSILLMIIDRDNIYGLIRFIRENYI
ncbi:MAG: MOP flippase family protein [Ignavibacteriaceae bacterium]